MVLFLMLLHEYFSRPFPHVLYSVQSSCKGHLKCTQCVLWDIKMYCWICRRSRAVSRHALKVKFWVFLFTCWMRLQWYSVPKHVTLDLSFVKAVFFLIAIAICCSFAFVFPNYTWSSCLILLSTLLMRNNTALYLWLSVECVETLNPVMASFKTSNKAFVKKKKKKKSLRCVL